MTCLAPQDAPTAPPNRHRRAIAGLDAAALGHEIRSPLSAVRLLADLAEAASGDNERHRLLSMIRLAAEQAMSVAENCLVDGALSSGRLALTPTEIDPVAVARDIVDLYGPVLAAEGRHIELDVEARTPRAATTDVTRLRQVLINLVTNAIRASGDSNVVVRIGRGDRRMRVAFSVEDNGPGLPEGLAVVPFGKGARSPGTGLGLWISSKIVKSLGGQLTFDTLTPHGTAARFSIRRRLGLARHPATTATSGDDAGPDSAQPLRGLVVDDSEVARQLMTTILASFGIETTTAADSAEAARRFADESVDLVVLDWSLRQESGSAVIDRLATIGELPPIIVVSAAKRRPNDRRIAAFLQKPFSPRELYDCLGVVLGSAVHDAKA
jgi:CheY-like chemotaxis protein